ncbi:hypothetical protein [Spiroplasma endosymbiont of Asaphidion curtum]
MRFFAILFTCTYKYNSAKQNKKVAFSFLRYCFEEVKQSANYII